MVSPIEYTQLDELDENQKMSVIRFKMDYIINRLFTVSGIGTSAGYKEKLKVCRDIYNNKIDEQTYAYLQNTYRHKNKDKEGNITGEIDVTMPAKIRQIPIVRTKIQSLLSKHKMRPLTPLVIAVDEDSVDRRREAYKNAILGDIDAQIDQRQGAIKAQQQAIYLQEVALQMQSKQLQESGQSDPTLEYIIKEANEEIIKLKKILQQKSDINLEDAKKISRYFSRNYRDVKEALCNKALEFEIATRDLKELFSIGLREQFITDETIYYVDYDPTSGKIYTEHVFPENFLAQSSEGDRYIDQADWAVRRLPMTIGDIKAFFSELEKSDHGHLYFQATQNTGVFNPLGLGGTFYPSSIVNNYDIFSRMDESINVFECYWKERSAVYLLVKDKPKEASKSQETMEILDILTKEEADKITKAEHKRNKTKIVLKYRNDLYKGYRIGIDIFVRCGKVEHALREIDAWGDVRLPFVGYAVNRFNEPNSLIWETKELQEVYNVLQYKKELIIVLSGVRGFLYDLSQKPQDMEMEELIYYRKMGWGLIQSLNADGEPSQFNQFQSFDDTLAPSVMTINEAQRDILNMVTMITGVTDQELGQISSSEQVGNTKLAIQQGSIVTEFYMQRAELLEEKVLSKIANLIPKAYGEGKRGTYLLGNEQQLLNIEAGIFDGAYFQTRVKSGENQRFIISTMREAAAMMLQNQQITGSKYIKLLDTNTIAEMKMLLAEYEEDFSKMLEAKEQGSQQAQEQAMQRQQQHEMQLKQLDAKMQQDLLMLKAKLEQDKLNAQHLNTQQMEALKVQADKEKTAIQEEGKKYAVDKEAEIERAYLEKETADMRVNAALQSAQLSIQELGQRLSYAEKIYSHKAKSKEKVKD